VKSIQKDNCIERFKNQRSIESTFSEDEFKKYPEQFATMFFDELFDDSIPIEKVCDTYVKLF
jgi:hypothetical protein